MNSTVSSKPTYLLGQAKGLEEDIRSQNSAHFLESSVCESSVVVQINVLELEGGVSQSISQLFGEHISNVIVR